MPLHTANQLHPSASETSPTPTQRRAAAGEPTPHLLTLCAALAIAFGGTACGGGSLYDQPAPAATAETSSEQVVASESVVRVSDDRPARDDPSDDAGDPAAASAPATLAEAAPAAVQPAPDDAAAEPGAPTFSALALDDEGAASTEATEATSETTTSTSAPYCERVPSIGLTGRVQTPAYRFGAIPSDGKDDTAAIQKAVDSMSAGDVLLFTPGKYVISKSIHVRRAGVMLVGDGATIHATNPDDQAILIEADSVTVAKLTLTAVTDRRGSAPRHARIAVAKGIPNYGGYDTVTGAVIRDNRIVPAGSPGTSLANGASATGILLLRANRFLVANNTIQRTLADGIHITMGSRNGRVLNNIVKETGDDMIAMVSYALSGTAALNSASKLLSSWDDREPDHLDRNILIAGNSLGGQYWGRGISVVGGEKITIARNRLDNVPYGAAVLLAREAHYQSFGVDNVLVEGNLLRNIQNKNPPYDFNDKFANASPTGHGAVEIHATLFEDEAANSTLKSRLAVRNVKLRNNTVEYGTVSGTRLGVNTYASVSARNSSGTLVTRQMVRGVVTAQSVTSSKFNALSGEPISIKSSTLSSNGIHCSSNLKNGSSYQPSVCKVSSPSVSGATLSCSSDGRLL